MTEKPKGKQVLGYSLVVIACVICCSIFIYLAPKTQQQKNTAQKTSSYYRRLADTSDFKALEGAPLTRTYSDVRSIKLVYELSSGILYFVNSSRFQYHYQFCREALGDRTRMEIFNTINYGNTGKRDYYLANLNFYPDLDKYTRNSAQSEHVIPLQIDHPKLMSVSCLKGVLY